MGPLEAWMTREGETDESLSPKVGLSRVQISRLRRRVYRPSVETARKLETITGIPAAEFILVERCA